MTLILNAFTVESAYETDPFMGLIPTGALTDQQMAEIHAAALNNPVNYGYDGLGQYQAGLMETEEQLACVSNQVRSDITGRPQRQEFGIEHAGEIVGTASLAERGACIRKGARFDGHDAVYGAQFEVSAWVREMAADEYSTSELIYSAISILLAETRAPHKSYTLLHSGEQPHGTFKRPEIITSWVGVSGTRELIR